MKPKTETTLVHQIGESGEAVNDKQNLCEIETQAVETLAGKTQVSWDFDSSVSRMGKRVKDLIAELKNQWGWAGYATRDLKRCGIGAQLVGLFYNWWSLFVKFVQEGESREAITSRPLMLGSVAKSSSHQRQRLVRLSPFHVEGRRYALKLNRASGFLSELILTAEQLDCTERWRRILQRTFKKIWTTQPSIGPPETAPS